MELKNPVDAPQAHVCVGDEVKHRIIERSPVMTVIHITGDGKGLFDVTCAWFDRNAVYREKRFPSHALSRILKKRN